MLLAGDAFRQATWLHVLSKQVEMQVADYSSNTRGVYVKEQGDDMSLHKQQSAYMTRRASRDRRLWLHKGGSAHGRPIGPKLGSIGESHQGIQLSHGLDCPLPQPCLTGKPAQQPLPCSTKC